MGEYSSACAEYCAPEDGWQTDRCEGRHSLVRASQDGASSGEGSTWLGSPPFCSGAGAGAGAGAALGALCVSRNFAPASSLLLGRRGGEPPESEPKLEPVETEEE